MAFNTKCPNPSCNSTTFELSNYVTIKNCRHQLAFIRCSLCGSAISAIDIRQNYILEEMAKKLGIK